MTIENAEPVSKGICGKWNAPKKGGHMHRSYCNGVCHNYKANRPGGRSGKNPYDTHCSCTKCGNVWMLKTSCTIGKNGALRCPCCNWLMRVKAKRKYGGNTAALYNKGNS